MARINSILAPSISHFSHSMDFYDAEIIFQKGYEQFLAPLLHKFQMPLIFTLVTYTNGLAMPSGIAPYYTVP